MSSIWRKTHVSSFSPSSEVRNMPKLLARLVAVSALALGIPMLGAGSAVPPPVIVIYPFSASSNLPPSIGATVAVAIATQLAQGGDIVVKQAPADTQRTDYLQTARTLGADYYLFGFASPIGTDIGVVEQLVSTKSGVSAWRNNVALAAPDDVRDSASQLHDAILQLGTVHVPEPVSRANGSSPVGASASSSPGRSLSTSVVVAVATAPPTPRPSRGSVLVLHFSGNVIDALKNYVSESIVRTLPQYDLSGGEALVEGGVSSLGLLMCAQSGADELLGGSISADQGDLAMGWFYDTRLQMRVYDCRNLGAKPRTIVTNATNGNVQTAIDIAVSQALKQLADARAVSTR